MANARLVAVDVRFFNDAVQIMNGQCLAGHYESTDKQPSIELDVAHAAVLYWRGVRVDNDDKSIEVLVEGTWQLAEGPL